VSRDYFDWTTIEDDIVIPEQAQIACYNNPKGDIVLRQAGQYGPDEDTWIVLHRSHALILAKAILDRAGLDVEIVPLTSLLVQNRDGVLMRPFPNQDVIDRLKEVEKAGRAADLVDDSDASDQIAGTKSQDKTAAERQRRRRQKQRQRDGVTEGVTGRDNHRDTERDTVTTAPQLPWENMPADRVAVMSDRAAPQGATEQPDRVAGGVRP
jgi:hypothetical protein